MARLKAIHKLHKVKKYLPLLHVLASCKGKNQRKGLIEHGSSELIKTIGECCTNSLRGNIPHSDSDKQILKRHKKWIHALVDKRVPFKRKKAVIIQHGGFLGVILKPILAGLAGLLGLGGGN
jgi:hypothetical protein